MSSFVWYLPLAQITTNYGQYGILQMLIWVVIIGACCGVAYVALQQFGVKIPPALVTVLWILIVAAVAIFVIRLLAGM